MDAFSDRVGGGPDAIVAAECQVFCREGLHDEEPSAALEHCSSLAHGLHDPLVVLPVLHETRRRETLIVPVVWIEHLLPIVVLLIVGRIVIILSIEVHSEALGVHVAKSITEIIGVRRLAKTPRVKLITSHLRGHRLSHELLIVRGVVAKTALLGDASAHRLAVVCHLIHRSSVLAIQIHSSHQAVQVEGVRGSHICLGEERTRPVHSLADGHLAHQRLNHVDVGDLAVIEVVLDLVEVFLRQALIWQVLWHRRSVQLFALQERLSIVAILELRLGVIKHALLGAVDAEPIQVLDAWHSLFQVIQVAQVL